MEVLLLSAFFFVQKAQVTEKLIFHFNQSLYKEMFTEITKIKIL